MNWEAVLVIGAIVLAICLLVELLSRRATRNAEREEEIQGLVHQINKPTSDRTFVLGNEERLARRAERARNYAPTPEGERRRAERMRNQASDDWATSPTNPLNPASPLSIYHTDSSRDDSCAGYDSGSSDSGSSCGGAD
ncbi:MAG: hypothetical protein K2Y51_00360 [Gammaproteobacteria bacterium]|nr:hypothetical protein [Gammaproteobacteria bacterium]